MLSKVSVCVQSLGVISWCVKELELVRAARRFRWMHSIDEESRDLTRVGQGIGKSLRGDFPRPGLVNIQLTRYPG